MLHFVIICFVIFCYSFEENQDNLVNVAPFTNIV